MKKTAEENLILAAELLSRSVLKMCRRLQKNTREEEPDPKLLKEAGAVLKEAVSVVMSLGKNEADKGEGIRIVFDTGEDFIR